MARIVSKSSITTFGVQFLFCPPFFQRSFQRKSYIWKTRSSQQVTPPKVGNARDYAVDNKKRKTWRMAWYQLPHCWSKLFPNARSLWLLGTRSHSKVMKRLHRKTDKEIDPLVAVLLVAQSCPTLVTPGTVAHQAPVSMGFSRQEYWSGLPFPPPGDLPKPGTEPGSPSLQAVFTNWATREG